VFGFGRALARGYAFVARPNGGEHNARFIGYENSLTIDPGTLLLDATADIDGVTQLCPWRKHHEMPPASYAKLHVVSVPSLLPKNQRLSTYLRQSRANKLAYAAWMVDVIQAHMEPGQRGLVVCKKTLIDENVIPNWPDGDPRRQNKVAFTKGYGWDLDDRKLSVTHWGDGIGANLWRDADVVFLFDEFFLPRRISIATAQGLLGYNASQGPLKELKGYNSHHAKVDLLWEGHLLRWMKQMALRGNGRRFDEHGVCGHQKLVTSADRTRLLANFDRLFPEATLEVIKTSTADKQAYADKLIDILSRPGLPNVLSTSWISDQLGKPWRDIGRHIMAVGGVKQALENLGWRYVLRKGKLGSTFERIPKLPAHLMTPQCADHLPMSARRRPGLPPADTQPAAWDF
jgi:hypothetical protein